MDGQTGFRTYARAGDKYVVNSIFGPAARRTHAIDPTAVPSRQHLTVARQWAVALATLTFSGYFFLIVLCDLTSPEPFGAPLTVVSDALELGPVAPGSPAARAGLAQHDRLLMLDGQPALTSLAWTTTVSRIVIDRPLPVTYVRDGRVISGEITFQTPRTGPWSSLSGSVLLASRALQFVSLVLAVLLAVRPTGFNGKLGSWLLATIAVYCTALPPRFVALWEQLPLPIGVLFFVPLASTIVVGGVLFAFLATFLESPWPRSRVALVLVPFVPIVAWQFVFSVALVYRPADLPRLPNLVPLIVALNFVYVLAGTAVLLVRYRALDDLDQRRRVRLLVAGIVGGSVSAAPAVSRLWAGGGPVMVFDPPLALQIAYTAFLMMPIAFWWAVARHKLFGIQFIVRRGLQYAFARRAIVFVTPVVITAFVIEASLYEQDTLRNLLVRHAYWYAAMLVGLVVFHRRRAPWLDALDRHLFRERYDACQLLRSIAAKTRVTTDLKSAAEFAVDQIDNALHLEWLAIYFRRGGESSFRAIASRPAVVEALPGGISLMAFVRSLNAVLEIDLSRRSWLRGHMPAAELALLDRIDLHLLVPVVVGEDGPEALIALGRRKSGEPFSREDSNLLQAIGESLAELIETSDAEDDWDEHLREIADSVVAGARVDWGTAASVRSDKQRLMLRELKMLGRLMDVHVSDPGPQASVAAEQPPASAIGSTATRWGSFELLECIGSGNFGSVYRARDRLDREVAIKLLHHEHVDRGRLLEEAKRLASVRHPNVVHVYGADDADGVAGFWMELIAGDTLAALVARHGPFGAEEAAAIGRTLCAALAAVHVVGLIHQDVKARNVMRERGDRAGRYVLMDFGAAVRADHRNAPRCGTPAYMAPELFDGAAASVASDLYSLGVLLFHLVTCEFPVGGESLDEVRSEHERSRRRWLRDRRPGLPDAFLEAIDRALARDPVERYRTAGEFAHALHIGGT